jgi:20S proteasome subunit alpha 4
MMNRKANAIGRSSKTVREFLERNHKDQMDRDQTIELTIKSLLEVVQTGAKNIEIAIMAPGQNVEMLEADAIEKIVEKINSEKDAEAHTARRGGRPGGGNGAGGVAAQGPEQVLASRPAGEGTGAPPE